MSCARCAVFVNVESETRERGAREPSPPRVKPPMPLLPLLPAQEEEVLCAYLKRTGTMLIRRADLELEVWFALSSIIRMPRGGVSGNGSQYGSTTPLRGLPRSMISAMFGKHCNHYPQTRFGQDAATGKLVAVPVTR